MFDLDKAVAAWRNNLRAAGMKNRTLLNELESHLRDEVERQLKSGSDVRGAFESAVRQLGQPAELKSEFNKLGEARIVWLHKFMRVCSLCCAFVYSALGTNWLQRTEMTSGLRALGFLAIGSTALFVLGIPFYHRFLPAISNPIRRVSIVIGLVLAGVVPLSGFMNFILPHLNLTEGQFGVTLLWMMMPGVSLPCIGYGLEMAARRQLSRSAT